MVPRGANPASAATLVAAPPPVRYDVARTWRKPGGTTAPCTPSPNVTTPRAPSTSKTRLYGLLTASEGTSVQVPAAGSAGFGTSISICIVPRSTGARSAWNDRGAAAPARSGTGVRTSAGTVSKPAAATALSRTAISVGAVS